MYTEVLFCICAVLTLSVAVLLLINKYRFYKETFVGVYKDAQLVANYNDQSRISYQNTSKNKFGEKLKQHNYTSDIHKVRNGCEVQSIPESKAFKCELGFYGKNPLHKPKKTSTDDDVYIGGPVFGSSSKTSYKSHDFTFPSDGRNTITITFKRSLIDFWGIAEMTFPDKDGIMTIHTTLASSENYSIVIRKDAGSLLMVPTTMSGSIGFSPYVPHNEKPRPPFVDATTEEVSYQLLLMGLDGNTIEGIRVWYNKFEIGGFQMIFKSQFSRKIHSKLRVSNSSPR